MEESKILSVTKTFKIVLTTEMLGTIPKNKDVYEKWIASLRPEGVDSEEIDTVKEIEEKGWTGFHQDEQGIFILEYMIKGFLKHAGNVLKEQLGIKALRSKIDDFVFIRPRRIHVGKFEPDGVVERPLAAFTPAGKIVTLVRSDYLAPGTEFSFEVTVLKHKEVTMEVIETLFQHGQLMGLGQFRNGGYGRFKVIEPINGAE